MNLNLSTREIIMVAATTVTGMGIGSIGGLGLKKLLDSSTGVTKFTKVTAIIGGAVLIQQVSDHVMPYVQEQVEALFDAYDEVKINIEESVKNKVKSEIKKSL